jgi:hypothetical protein
LREWLTVYLARAASALTQVNAGSGSALQDREGKNHDDADLLFNAALPP